jgi:hypothetical protein
MKTVGIRELTAPVIARAAERDELVGITNGRVFAGVLVPVSRSQVQHLVDQNITRVMRNITRGEREVRAASAPADESTPDAGRMRFTTVDDVADQQGKTSGKSGIDVHGMRRVSLRSVNGTLLEEAAEQNQPIAVTTDHIVAGVIFPVNQRWVAQLIEMNLSRVLNSIELGEKEMSSQQGMTTLDDLYQTERRRHAMPNAGIPTTSVH